MIKPDIKHRHWLAGFLLGLISSTYSTVLVSLGAGRIGRDPAVDWMQVATVYFGTGMISEEPTWPAIIGGILVHQSADIFWAVFFFGGLWHWTRHLNPPLILLVGLPWALFSAGVEYYFILPWLQPWLPMQVPYWTAASVHIVSALVYPLFPLLHRLAGSATPLHRRFVQIWSGLLAGLLVVIGTLAIFGANGQEPAFAAGQAELVADRRFLRDMTAHHRVGLELAQMAAQQAVSPDLRDLGELMAAEHKAEIERLQLWWRSGFAQAMPDIDAQTYQKMVGMPPSELLEGLAQRQGMDFETLFLPVMLRHHEGAIVMCNQLLARFNDGRTALLALAIRHAQLAQMEKMRRMLRARSVDGAATVPYEW